MRARIFSGSLVVQGMTRKPAWWSSTTLTGALGPRTVASTGESVGVGAPWALAWALAAVRRPRKGPWLFIGGMVKRTVAVNAAARMEISMWGWYWGGVDWM